MTTNSNDVLEVSPESNKSTDKRITKKDLKALFWRSFPTNERWFLLRHDSGNQAVIR